MNKQLADASTSAATAGPNSPGTTDPTVAIVVLNWNGWHDTEKCLCSLRQLEYVNRMVVVVDNGSTDGSARRLREAFQDVTVLENEQNLGFARGNNVGIRHALRAGADYVWLLNNDTVVDAYALRSMVEAAEADPRLGAVGAVIYSMEEPRVQAWGGGNVNLWTGHAGHSFGPDRTVSYITGSSMLLRREALDEVGLFDERYFFSWEDTDLSFRLRKAGWKIGVEKNARVWHKESATVGRGTATQARHFNRGLVLFMRTHAAMPLVPTVVGTLLKARGAFSNRRWNVLREILRGWIEGWRG